MAGKNKYQKLEKWMFTFTDKIRKFYEEAFYDKPKGLTEKEWIDFRHRAAIEFFDRLIPTKRIMQRENTSNERVKPVKIVFKNKRKNATSNIPTPSPTESLREPEEVRADVDGDSGGEDSDGVSVAGE